MDQGYFPERRGDGIVRDPAGGDGAGSVVPREPDYGAPVCSHFGNNVYASGAARPATTTAAAPCAIRRRSSTSTISIPRTTWTGASKQPLAERAQGMLRPEVEKHGDGIVCVTLFVPERPEIAEAAALEMARHMGLQEPEVINRRVMHPAEGSLFEIKGRLDMAIKIDDLLPPAQREPLPEAEIEAWVRPRAIHVVAATVGEDEHSVGLHEILDIKHGGIEKYGFRCHDLGTSVPIERMLDAAGRDRRPGGAHLDHRHPRRRAQAAHAPTPCRLAVERGLRERLVLVAAAPR